MTPLLADAIERFKDTDEGQWSAEQPNGMCGPTSMAFIDFLAERGIEGREVFMAGPIDPEGHEVVLAEGYFIDWTMRQYDEAADHPELIEPWPYYRVLERDDDRNQALVQLLTEAQAGLDYGEVAS
jgi:hypothetical protein